jgi:stearoyl-CoA desaturase (delta-9 desaturase)
MLLLIGIKYFLFCYAVPLTMTWFAIIIGSVVVGHKYGSRRYNTNDNSRNNTIVGFLTCGEGFHNNHHGKPTREVFSEGRYEFDPLGVVFSKLFPTTR